MRQEVKGQKCQRIRIAIVCLGIWQIDLFHMDSSRAVTREWESESGLIQGFPF